MRRKREKGERKGWGVGRAIQKEGRGGGACVSVCVCVRERERELDKIDISFSLAISLQVPTKKKTYTTLADMLSKDLKKFFFLSTC